MDVLCMIEGKCAPFGAKPVHLSGHLPRATCEAISDQPHRGGVNFGIRPNTYIGALKGKIVIPQL
jgi:hypothetical protein